MIDDLKLGEAQVHPSMPAPHVEFVRQLWRAQENESRHTWSRELVTARRPVFLGLLASEMLGEELQRVYEIAVAPKIAEALTRQAVHIPGLWMSEDKRTKEEKVAQVSKLKSAIETVVGLLDKDRSVPSEEEEQDTTETVAIRDRKANRRSSRG